MIYRFNLRSLAPEITADVVVIFVMLVIAIGSVEFGVRAMARLYRNLFAERKDDD